MTPTASKLLHEALATIEPTQLSILTSTTEVNATLTDYSSESQSKSEVAHDLVQWCVARGRVRALVDALLASEFKDGAAVKALAAHLAAHPKSLDDRWHDRVTHLSVWGKVALAVVALTVLSGAAWRVRVGWVRRNPWKCVVRRLPLPPGTNPEAACFVARLHGDPSRPAMRAWERYELTLTRRMDQPAASRLVVPCEPSQVLLATYEQRGRAECVQNASRRPCSIPLAASCGSDGVFRLRVLQCGPGAPPGAPTLPTLYIDRGEHEDRVELSCVVP